MDFERFSESVYEKLGLHIKSSDDGHKFQENAPCAGVGLEIDSIDK